MGLFLSKSVREPVKVTRSNLSVLNQYIEAIEAVEPATDLRDLGCKLVEMILVEVVKRQMDPPKVSINYKSDQTDQYFEIKIQVMNRVKTLRIVPSQTPKVYLVTNSLGVQLAPNSYLSADLDSHFKIHEEDINADLETMTQNFLNW